MSSGKSENTNIPSFIEKVKSTGSLLIAIISDGKFYENIFESNQVKTVLCNNNAITLDIKFPSQNYNDFAAFYKLGTPPFICFIASNGVVVEAIRGEISQEYLIKILKYSLENIGRGNDSNQVYYPLNELVNLPEPEPIPILETVKTEKQIVQEDKPMPMITVKKSEPKVTDNIVTKRQIISNNCRIKFTLPDGSHISNSFQPTNTLAELKHFLRDRIPGLKDITIIRPHPREEFQPDQDVMTLQDLDIRTGSGLIVHIAVTEIAKFSIRPIFTAIFAFFAAIFAYFFPARTNQNNTQPQIDTTHTSSIAQNAKSNSSTRVIGRRGNMFRLSDLRDKDDESNTYNGNSTQQQ
ncbi:UBX domain-containing protein 4 isoform X1 [Oopsacas minuta]|uniref:UBX domain-containing protein 4 n=1 Tax=Oopsacas minuta TaxID=111878 RepID=A0AAV7JZ57_9METZ|nr:UBX domain-containing protein 4 isoform X1 [Oopsacas minuta]